MKRLEIYNIGEKTPLYSGNFEDIHMDDNIVRVYKEDQAECCALFLLKGGQYITTVNL